MRRALAVSLVLGAAMAATSALTGALTPQPRAPLAHELFDLDRMIPARFGRWTVDPSVVPLTPDPEQQGVLEKIYDQTLSRTYIDPDGQRVMLSIAYGGDQSKSLQLHLPEVCYVAQGFEMVQQDDGVLSTRDAQVPVTRLVARLHERNEPITYWITIGDKATRSGIEQKLRRLAFGLAGQVPDGMLVRVSTIGNDALAGWRVQERFVADMLAALAPRDRARLVGGAKRAAAAARAGTPGTAGITGMADTVALAAKATVTETAASASRAAWAGTENAANRAAKPGAATVAGVAGAGTAAQAARARTAASAATATATAATATTATGTAVPGPGARGLRAARLPPLLVLPASSTSGTGT